jgi:nucleotide-binding universal stress UspA family protein
MKILFATDGSPAALAALESLLRHESWFAARPEITLVHVHAPIPYGMAAGWVGRKTMNEFYAEESAKALQPARDALDRQGAAYTVEARVGEPAKEIVTQARDGGFDAIALGTHGHTALATLMLGSVAQKVLTQSTVPVLVFR